MGQAGSFKANRVAYYLHYDKDPGELKVLHSCDRGICCSPFHLSLGTQDDNMKDMSEKGRARQGSGVNTAKLNNDQVREIRKLYKNGIDKVELAKMFNISTATAHSVANGFRYKNVL